jgi:hypothetical protein
MKTSTVLLLALGIAAANFPSGLAAGAEMQRVEVRLPDKPSAVVERIYAVFSRVIQERTGIEPARSKNGTIILGLRDGLGKEGYEIADGKNGEILITGNDERGLLYGVGAFLRSSKYQPNRFEPGAFRGKSAPASPLRIAYLASHTGNWYENAPQKDVQQYIEELGLWGYNAIMVCFPAEQFDSFSDPKAQQLTAHLLKLLGAAKQIGLKTVMVHCSNNTYKSLPAGLEAVETGCKQITALGIHACPNKPGGRERLLREWAEVLEAYRSVGLDYVCFWPYDNGGCNCEACRPWGANGYISICKDMAATFREFNPKGEVILSSWRFLAGEWHDLYDVLGENPGWAQYMLANSCRGFPDDVAKSDKETVERGTPGNLTLMVFPEISMLGMWPWGGRGAAFRTEAVKEDIEKARRIGAASIMPYSEGIYEDVSKVLWVQSFWDTKRSVDDILEEYVRYEYAPQVLPEALEVIKTLGTMQEISLKSKKFSPNEAADGKLCGDFVDRVEPKLPAYVRASWRWKLFALRCRIESCLRQGRCFQADGDTYTEEAQRYFDELNKIYFVDDRTLAFTRPGIFDRQQSKKQQVVDDESAESKQPKKKAEAPSSAKKLPIAKVTASSTYAQNVPKNLTDGILAETNDKNCWASDKQKEKTAWILLDLGETKEVGGLALQFRKIAGKYAFITKVVSVDLSEDGEKFTEALTSTTVPEEGDSYSPAFWEYPVNARTRFLRIRLGPSQYKTVPQWLGMLQLTEIHILAP